MNRQTFFAALRQRNSGLFGTSLTAGQVEGCEAILDAAEGYPLSWTAYVLATAYHETGRRMQPIREANASSDAQAISRLDAWARKIGRTSNIYWRPDADGKAWFGRGFVQLTHKDNYRKASALVGADLVANPSLAMRKDYAAKILCEGCRAGLFTGRKLADYLPGDYIGARRIVNGLDKANEIAAYARSFEAALRAAGLAETPKPAPQAQSPAKGAAATVGGAAAAGGAIAAFPEYAAQIIGAALFVAVAVLMVKLIKRNRQ